MNTFNVFKDRRVLGFGYSRGGGSGAPFHTPSGDGIGQAKLAARAGRGTGSTVPLILCTDFSNLRARAISLTSKVEAP